MAHWIVGAVAQFEVGANTLSLVEANEPLYLGRASYKLADAIHSC